MNKHYPPAFRAKQYHCPYCQVYAKQEFNCLPLARDWPSPSAVWRSRCDHCSQDCYWIQTGENEGTLLVPAACGTPASNPYMPQDVLADYSEAASILKLSPRGSAALLRLSLQKLMVHLGKPGKNINDDIKTLVAEGLPVMIQQALDYCRVVGNNAVHPGELSLNDTPEMAWIMFDMINMIVQLKIAGPKELEQLYMQLPAGAREAIEKRDAKPPAPSPPNAP